MTSYSFCNRRAFWLALFISTSINGKAVGVCLVSAEDTANAGDHLQQNYVIMISDEIEHEASRIWKVLVQQSVYF